MISNIFFSQNVVQSVQRNPLFPPLSIIHKSNCHHWGHLDYFHHHWPSSSRSLLRSSWPSSSPFPAAATVLVELKLMLISGRMDWHLPSTSWVNASDGNDGIYISTITDNNGCQGENHLTIWFPNWWLKRYLKNWTTSMSLQLFIKMWLLCFFERWQAARLDSWHFNKRWNSKHATQALKSVHWRILKYKM